MTSKLRKHQLLATGLTQEDIRFRDALKELSGEPVDFYDYRSSAYNRLNHAMIGDDIDLQHPVNVVGLVDYDTQTLSMTNLMGEETTYNFDSLDPRYLATINQANPKAAKQVPLTDIAVELLDDLTPDVEADMKPEVAPHSLSGSNAVLQRSFENEMVFQVELEDYIKDNELEGVLDAHSQEVSELIDKSSFEASFTDGLEDLGQKTEELAADL